jgi:hypothetical protein
MRSKHFRWRHTLGLQSSQAGELAVGLGDRSCKIVVAEVQDEQIYKFAQFFWDWACQTVVS